MNREQLEAAIRGLLSHIDIPTPRLNSLVAEILFDADAYAVGDSPEVTAMRRLVLETAPVPEGVRR